MDVLLTGSGIWLVWRGDSRVRAAMLPFVGQSTLYFIGEWLVHSWICCAAPFPILHHVCVFDDTLCLTANYAKGSLDCGVKQRWIHLWCLVCSALVSAWRSTWWARAATRRLEKSWVLIGWESWASFDYLSLIWIASADRIRSLIGHWNSRKWAIKTRFVAAF